jgi:hypothetical protein
MGPGGELRYPSCPTEKLNQPGSSSELGEFQCYDKVRSERRSIILSLQYGHLFNVKRIAVYDHRSKCKA